MFYYLKGKLVLVNSNMCVIDCGGVGYKLTISALTSEKLANSEGKDIQLFTYLAVREDGMELFGFDSNEQRHTFNMLTGVSGVGPKAAMSVLSVMTPEKLAMAVCTEDAKAIAKAPNIGAKTAARIILELKDKIAKDISASDIKGASTVDTPVKNTGGNLSEAAEALMVLGYDKSSVTRALQGLDASSDVGIIIREALKKLSR